MPADPAFIFTRRVTQAVAINAPTLFSAQEAVRVLGHDEWATIAQSTPEGALREMGTALSPDVLDHNQPHVKVIYDKAYVAGGPADYDPFPHTWSNEQRDGYQEVFVPYRLISQFRSLQAAFTFLTQVRAIHLADYENEVFYTHDGKEWPKEEYEHIPGLLTTASEYLTC